MIVTISTSGGIGGFGLGPEKRVDLDQVPADLRADACAVLTDAHLEPLTRKKGKSVADGLTYRISVEEAGRTLTYAIPENALPPDMLDMLDALSADR